MIITLKQTKPGTDLERELAILTRDTHSPSGRLLHDALTIESTMTVGYGKTFKIAPKRVSAEQAVATYKELAHRSPALLEALLETAEKEGPHLEVHILNNGYEEPSTMTSHEQLEAIPILIAWLSGSS
jgi:transketolase N-terminal domain/subunit